MKKIYLFLLSISVILSLIIIFLILTPPKREYNSENYDLKSAIDDLQQIASKPHSVADRANLNEVKDYIVNRFSQMGLEASIKSYEVSNWFGNYEVNNIIAQIDGEENAPYILIMAHYDSVMENLYMEPTESTGMADDGYGVVTLLQIAEHFSSSEKALKNGIKFLITDSEETGPLEGSNAELKYNESHYQNVELVINLEGRGFDGPVFMFQTSANNPNLINLLNKANYPVSNSFMTNLFEFLPNFTDLSPFLDKGYSGLNFSTLGHLKYYHSDEDNLANLSEDTLNHYGIQIMPIVDSLVYDKDIKSQYYIDQHAKYTFFNLLPNLICKYSFKTQIALISITILVTLCSIAILKKSNFVNINRLIKTFALYILYLLISVVAGTILMFIVSFIYGVAFNPIFMFDIKYDWMILAISIILWGVFITKKHIYLKKNNNFDFETLIAGILINSALALVMSYLFVGGAYIFVVPNIFASLFLIFHTLNYRLARNIFGLLHLIISVVIYGPMLYILYYAFTIGILGIILFFVTPLILTIIPLQVVALKELDSIESYPQKPILV